MAGSRGVETRPELFSEYSKTVFKKAPEYGILSVVREKRLARGKVRCHTRKHVGNTWCPERVPGILYGTGGPVKEWD